MEQISGSVSALLVKYPNLHQLAKRAFITYAKSIHNKSDKEVFDTSKLPLEAFAASLGLPMTPRIRFINKKKGKEKPTEAETAAYAENDFDHGFEVIQRRRDHKRDSPPREEEDDILVPKETSVEVDEKAASVYDNSS